MTHLSRYALPKFPPRRRLRLCSSNIRVMIWTSTKARLYTRNLYDTAPRGSCFNFSLLVGRKFLCKFEKGVNYSFAYYFMLPFNSFIIIHPAHFFRNSHSLLWRLSTKTCYLCNTSQCFCVSNNKSSSSTLKVTTVQSCTLCVCFFVIH